MYLDDVTTHRLMEACLAMEIELRLTRLEMLAAKAGFDPNQPRIPAGQPGGGQWTKLPYAAFEDVPAEASIADTVGDLLDDTVDYVTEHPVETAITVLSLIPAVRVAKLAHTAWQFWSRGGKVVTNPKFRHAIQSIEHYFGGKPERVFRNPSGDLIMMKGKKKIRFDIQNPHPHKEPHFHLQKQTNSGKWRNVGKPRYNFKEGD
ncbi:MAG: hypothetical protein H6908_06455 [Hyphomicrobiales bacterium]|nr:hypothetical protein [Hyphomicrobiales bacterium]